MTKEITKARILQEIQDKFKLREFKPEIFAFSETVTPIYDIKSHLERIERIAAVANITSGPVAKTFFTVPGTERWWLERYNVIFITGSFTVAGVMLGRPSAAEYLYLDLAAGQNVSYARDLPKPVLLNPGERIYIYIDGYTSTGNLELLCDVIKEDIR